MGFVINTRHLPHLQSYAEAQRRYNATTPIRGNPGDIRPLGKRAAQHMRISYNKGDDSYSCVLYNTEVVTYYPDGRVRLQTGGRATQSTCAFLARAFSPINHAGIGQRGRHLVLSFPSLIGKYMLPNHKPLFLAPQAAPTATNPNATALKPIDPEPFVVHTVNRKAMNQARKQYKPFMQYLRSMGKLTEYAQTGSTTIYTPQALLALMRTEDNECFAQAYAQVVQQAGKTGFAWVPDNNGRQAWGRVWRCNEGMCKRFIDHMIKREHKDTVFTRTVLPIGTYKKDANIKYT